MLWLTRMHGNSSTGRRTRWHNETAVHEVNGPVSMSTRLGLDQRKKKR